MKTLYALLLSLLLWTHSAFGQEVVKRFQGSFNGTDQVVIAAPGAGKKLCVRSIFLNTEGSSTTWRFFAKNAVLLLPTPTPVPTVTPGATPAATATATPTATPTSAALSPSMAFLANAGAVVPADDACWMMLGENQGLVVTANNPVDVFGTYKILPK